MKKINILLYTLLTGFAALFATGANAQTWDFSTMSQADKDACSADANWLLGTERWCYVKELANEPLMANGVELEYAKGLTFTAGAPSEAAEGKAKVRCNYGSERLELNGNGVKLAINGLTAGQVVKVSCMTGKNGEARGLNAENLSGTIGFGETSTEEQTCTGTVTADGSVTLTTNVGGMYIYSISVSSYGGTDVPVLDDNHDVSINTAVNQMRLAVGSDIKYYNTDEVSVAIDKAAGTVTVTPVAGTWQDVYTKSVSKIDFSLAESTGSEGEIQDGEIKITEAKGWNESLYAKWAKYDGASSYNVYVKGGQYSDWTKIDQQLVRDYGSYARADVVGLVAGSNYAIKVVGVDDKGAEISGVDGVAENMTVVNYSREGFAHLNRSEGVGAYNNDGSLKAGAKVLYVTANTAKTVSTTVNVDGKQQTFTGIQAILNAYQKGDDTTPIAFRIIGLVEADDLDEMGSSSEGLQIKGKNSYSTLNITIEGIGEDAAVRGFGFLCRNAGSVEFRNFAIMRCMDDGISLDTKNTNIWIHNMDLFYGEAGSGDHAKGDGSIDVKADSKYVTIDNNRFWDTGKSSMCGMTSESGPNYITYHHNWFDHSDSRHPRIRTMSVHIWNNYFQHNDTYGVGATTGASVFVDRNYFESTKRPMMSSKQGTDATGDGTFSGENGGIIKAYGNVFADKPSNFSYITWQDNNTSFDAYEVSSPEESVPSTVKTLSGGTTYDNFDTNSSLMYDYNADNAADVPAKVTGYYGAGRLNHGDIKFTIPDEAVISGGREQCLPELANLIDNYSSSIVKVYGDENAESGEQGSEGGTTEGGETGGDSGEGTETPDTPVIEGTVTCDFTGRQNNNEAYFDIVGSYSNSKGTATVNGTTYSDCLKIESSTSIKFTISQKMTLKLYFGDDDTKCNIKINGEQYDGDANNVITATLEPGDYELKKKDTCNLFYIELIPVE